MPDVPSQQYDQGYLLQKTVSKGALVTFHIYRFTDLTVSMDPEKLLEAERILFLLKDRVMWKHPPGKAEFLRRAADMGAAYAVLEDDHQLREHLQRLALEAGYTQQESRNMAVRWLGQLDIESN